MAPPKDNLPEAKSRLDRLIKKSRAHLYKPIGIAEVLFQNRLDSRLDLSGTAYKRRSYDWTGDIARRLYGRPPSLNSRYWDQLFDEAVIPPRILVALGEANRQTDGLVEAYIYAHIYEKFAGILKILDYVQSSTPDTFDLVEFLRKFEADPSFRRSVDKAYEVIVYSLFDALTNHLGAVVTLSVDSTNSVLSDFQTFSRLVLGVDPDHPEISQPARLYRVGTANAADAGLDMWANFGPAVQVKHLSLSPDNVDDICDSLRATQIIIVCKQVEAPSIASLLGQIGFRNKLRGIITELDLVEWYSLACSAKYRDSLGTDLLNAIADELTLEFPITQDSPFPAFFAERGYDKMEFISPWLPLDATPE